MIDLTGGNGGGNENFFKKKKKSFEKDVPRVYTYRNEVNEPSPGPI